jgi:RNA polymerase sigma-70 factor (ECF subfamily)
MGARSRSLPVRESRPDLDLAWRKERLVGADFEPTSAPDEESRAWVAALRADGERRQTAMARLHDLLLRAASFEIRRRRVSLVHLRADDLDDIAVQSADDALVAVLEKLDDYRGESRFTTWVYKFALLEAAVRLRRRAWQGREVPLEGPAWALLEDSAPSAQRRAEIGELWRTIRAVAEDELTPHQRDVFAALALNGVPIDVLAERLGTTRGALYKTLNDARRRLRARLAESGLALEAVEGRA